MGSPILKRLFVLFFLVDVGVCFLTPGTCPRASVKPRCISDEVAYDELLQRQQSVSERLNASTINRPTRSELCVVDVGNTHTFSNVAGCDYAKHEMQDVVHYLTNSSRFAAMGARLPKGVLLYGPSGCGKTLMARAIAGEANCTFIDICGSDFINKYVGVGSSKVRKIFMEARQQKPSLIFIDEIDAIGGKRSMDGDGGSKEYDTTLNQLLSEMDGFKVLDDVVVVGATNRIDKLDPALLRPKRFDWLIKINVPDMVGRHEIMKIHTQNKPLHRDVDLEKWASLCVGMTGADLEGLCNYAALLAIRENDLLVRESHFLQGFERVKVGYRTGHQTSNVTREKIAVHEMGHALTCFMTNQSIIKHISTHYTSKGAGGYTLFIPHMEDDDGLFTKSQVEAQLMTILGGRAAESLLLDEITTGAANDLKVAHEIAMTYATTYGFFKDWANMVMSPGPVEAVLQEAYSKTTALLSKHTDLLRFLARELRDQGEMTGQEFRRLMKKNNVYLR